MKILIVSSIDLVNPFVKELKGILERIGEVIVDKNIFWDETDSFDFLLFQWPEELFTNWKEPNEDELEELKKRLNSWQKKSKLGIIRHNYLPHYRETNNFQHLYDIVYESMEVVIHLGNSSKLDYQQLYSNKNFIRSQKQRIIPHPIYSGYPNSISTKQAREYFNIPLDHFVILLFGSIRHKEEIYFTHKVFKKAKISNKQLLVSNYPLPKFRGSKYLNPILKKIISLKDRRIYNFDFVAENDVQLFFKAADLILIPRRKVLNSGNLILGFSYGKVVIGPSSGNVGEILEKTGNPTFDFEDIDSGIEALHKGYNLVRYKDKGKENYLYASQKWSQDEISNRYKIILNELFFS